MNDESVSNDDTTPDLEPTPTPPAPAAAASDQTVQIPAASQSPKPSKFSRPRQLLAAGAAGLLLVGGLAGFGIGRATGSGDDGPRFARMGQFGPGQGYGRPGQRGPGRGNFGNGQGTAPGQGQGQGQAPGGQSDGQSGNQPPVAGSDGPGSDGT